MSNRIISEDSVDKLNDLIERVRMKVWVIEIDMENDEPDTYEKYQSKFEQVNSLLRDLEDTIKYL